MTGLDAISATSLSKKVEVPQTTLSKWLRNAGIVTHFTYPNQMDNNKQVMKLISPKRPEDCIPEVKLKAVLEDQLGAFLRKQGIHETNLQQWRLQMLNGLGKMVTEKKKKTNKRNTVDAKRIRSLEKELNRKEKALAETAALLGLKKKSGKSGGTRATTPSRGAKNDSRTA
jgi:hypothetical protein